MGRPRKPKIKAIGRSCKRKNIALTLFVIGRVGKFLTERGIDPSGVYFVPGGAKYYDVLNPNMQVQLTQREFEKLFKEAADYVRKRLRFATRHYATSKIEKVVDEEVDFLIHPDSVKYFEKVTPLNKQEAAQTIPLLVGKPSKDYPLSRCLGVNEENFELMKTKTKLEIYQRWAGCLKQGEVYDFNKISMKLSAYGRRALRAYLEEQESKASSFTITRNTANILIPVKGVGWEYQHTDVRLANNVLQKTVKKIFADFIQAATGAFIEHLKDQTVIMNGIELDRELKEALFSKIEPILDVSGLGYFTKVFKALRDSKDLESTTAEMLTADDIKLREAGVALNRIKQIIEESDDEITEEDSDEESC